MDWREQVTNLSRGRSLMLAIGALLVATYSVFMVLLKEGTISNLYNHDESSSCRFPAIYNFGDSNSDTGAVSAVFGPFFPPYGMTYFHKPSGRLSDGRLMIDFLAETLGLPYLSAYVDSIGKNFRHGANFAASGATIQPADAFMLNKTLNPLTLDVQLSQFEQFKMRTYDLNLEALFAYLTSDVAVGMTSTSATLGNLQSIFGRMWYPTDVRSCILHESEYSSEIKERLPRSEDYPRALYTFDIGQNDLHVAVTSMKEEQIMKYIPPIINELSSAIEKLYQGGARTFWIHNTGPVGCLPLLVEDYPAAPENVDEIGCVISYNKVAQEYNKQLKDKISELGTKLHESSLVYVDIYSVKYSLISEANKHGFTDPLGKCLRKDGNVYKACTNPLEYISWDGVHYTEAANKWVANHIRVPLTESCWPVSGSRR